MRFLVIALTACLLGSCGIGTKFLLDADELARFEAAGPIEPELDADRILTGLRNPGPYTVVPGDLLAVQGPKTLFAEPDPDGLRVRIQRGHMTRVTAKHTLHLPVVGEIDVKGKTLLEIERAIATTACPKFVKEYPAIVAQVVGPLQSSCDGRRCSRETRHRPTSRPRALVVRSADSFRWHYEDEVRLRRRCTHDHDSPLGRREEPVSRSPSARAQHARGKRAAAGR